MIASPIGAHVSVKGGLATGGLAYADAVAAGAVQVFVGTRAAGGARPATRGRTPRSPSA